MSLQGQTTLTDDEKITEAKRHVKYLKFHLTEMMDAERDFVQNTDDALLRYGAKAIISNKVLFWLRDLVLKY